MLRFTLDHAAYPTLPACYLEAMRKSAARYHNPAIKTCRWNNIFVLSNKHACFRAKNIFYWHHWIAICFFCIETGANSLGSFPVSWLSLSEFQKFKQGTSVIPGWKLKIPVSIETRVKAWNIWLLFLHNCCQCNGVLLQLFLARISLYLYIDL